MNDPEITEQSLRIMEHTDKTARGVYAKRKRTILAVEDLEQEHAQTPNIEPVVVTNKKAVVAKPKTLKKQL
jgi:hypothetical protein